MSTEKPYVIVCGISIHALEEAVNSRIEEGYIPTGGSTSMPRRKQNATLDSGDGEAKGRDQPMSILKFKSKKHPQQVAARGPAADIDDRALPASDFAKLHARFAFTVDVAAAAHNAKLDRFYTAENSGLDASWSGERVYCNPPYSNILPWISKAWREGDCPLIVMLLPANRTEQGWWQHGIEPHRDRVGSPLTVEFLRGRQRFLRPGQLEIGPNERPPFGLVLCIWKRDIKLS